MSESLGESPMTSFHIWLCMFEGVGRDSGYGIRTLISCMIQNHSMYKVHLYGM